MSCLGIEVDLVVVAKYKQQDLHERVSLAAHRRV